jgi:ribonuclease VapC
MKTYVLDASALMTFFENRPGADKVEEILTAAADAQRPLAMSAVNWGEVYYSIWRAHGEKAATAKLQDIAQLPIQVFGVDMEMAMLAASLKVKYHLPYADGFAAALAQDRKATLVTSDKDFRHVATAVKILWV